MRTRPAITATTALLSLCACASYRSYLSWNTSSATGLVQRTEQVALDLQCPVDDAELTLSLRAEVEAGRLAVHLVDPTGKTVWEIDATGGAVIDWTDRYDSNTGPWVLHLDLTDFTGDYEAELSATGRDDG